MHFSFLVPIIRGWHSCSSCFKLGHDLTAQNLPPNLDFIQISQPAWHDMTRYDTAYLNLVGVMLLGSVCLSKTEIETFAAKRSTKDALLSYEAVPQTKTPNTSVASGRIEWHCRTIRTQRWKWWRFKTASQKYGSWRWDRLLHGIRIFQILLAPFGSCWSLYVGFLIYRKLSSFW